MLKFWLHNQQPMNGFAATANCDSLMPLSERDRYSGRKLSNFTHPTR
jgi:hypothetical protein